MMTGKKKIATAFALIVGSVCIMVSCSKKDSSKLPDFDRKAMLQNFANNIIKPAFTDLQTTVVALKFATDAFTALPNDANLIIAQTAWDAAYCSWMNANSFNFGPAGEEGIRKSLVEEIGTWPADVATIETNISNNNTALNDFKRDNRGFNALEYLLFADGNNSNTATVFAASTNRKIYLTALVNKLSMQVEQVATAWNENYTTSFINNAGTDVGSSTSQMYNEFVRSFESIKNFKIGLPLGKRIGQTGVEPAKVEARYSGNTLRYTKLHIAAIENCWYGKSKNGSVGVGWKDYLSAVTGGNDLITRTELQMTNVKNALNALPATPSFEAQINSNNAVLSILHAELQRNVRNYKSDMSSLLGIAITFSSSDGD